MKTDDWVSLLAHDVEPFDAPAERRRRVAILAAGVLVALAGTIGVLRVNPALSAEFSVPMFWAREAYCAALSAAGFLIVMRLGRPAARLGLLPAAAAIPLAAMWVAAAASLLTAPRGHRLPLLFGTTAAACPWLIALIALPSLIAFVAVLRGLAPTSLRGAGAAAGFAAGALGALVYSVHCPELAAPFIGVWYLLGMLIPTAVGAAVGPRLLRW